MGVAEAEVGLAAGFFGGEAAGNVRFLLVGQVGFDLLGQVLIFAGAVLIAAEVHRCFPFLVVFAVDRFSLFFSAYSRDSPRIRPMARLILRQRPVAAVSSLRPLAVRR